MDKLSIKCLKSEKRQSGICYGKFVINSLSSGQGITIGNQLRRVLLGDLGGKAISAVRIPGLTHEFSIIPGVREDILEILLNLKGITFKSNTKEFESARLKVRGPKIVTANLIELSSNSKIVNPNHYIATVSTETIFELEFKIEYGTSYRLSSQSFPEENENFLKLDAVFMPVQKVDFKIENIYNDNGNITERLFLEIWTNGSITPTEALTSASNIIINLYTSLIENKKNLEIQTPKVKPKREALTIEPYNDMTIEELELSVRPYNCLKKAHINTVGDLLKYSPEQLKELRNFGQKSSSEVISVLRNKLGINMK